MITKSLSVLLLGALLAGSAAAATNDLAGFTTADELWQHIETYEKGPQGHPASREDLPKFYEAWFDEFETVLKEFADRYPEDGRRWEGRMHQLRIGALRTGLRGGEPDLQALRDGLAEVVHGKDVPPAIMTEARFGWLQVRAQLLADDATPTARDALDAEFEAFIKDHPKDPRAALLQFTQVDLWESSDPARADKILRELVKQEHQPLATAAKQRLAKLTLRRTPLSLKFTALDGEEFDLAQWRGKVVLIDFWATWCRPCMVDLPNVLAAYQKLQPRGFEVVGISLDENKEKLQEVLRANKMTWPQHFDGNGWTNAVSQRFGITQIPTQWLIDKKGYLRVTELRGDLAAAIEKLLAE